MIYAAFYSREAWRPEMGAEPRSLEDYVGCMLTSREVLAKTNPGAKYIVLTDPDTEPELVKRGLTTVPIADRSLPLMRRVMTAQRDYLLLAAEYTVLVAPDCLPCRDLELAVAKTSDLALAWRRNLYPVDSVAYVRNPSAHVYLLDRALGILGWLDAQPKTWDHAHWHGDMLAMGLALGPWRHLLRGGWHDGGEDLPEWDKRGRSDRGIRIVKPGGYTVEVHPFATHNYAPPKGKLPKKLNGDAFIIHFKGKRKNIMRDYCEKYLLADGAVA